MLCNGERRMNLDNRRLREIRAEKRVYQDRLDKADNETDCQIYQGKLECLRNEEKNILSRYGVKI
jgi:hypothetical protein